MIEEISFHTFELSDPDYEFEGMRSVTVKSPALRGRGDVSVWVPDASLVDTLLILLHGVWGSHWVWSQKAGVHKTARSMLNAGDIRPMVIAMPSDGLFADGSGYLAHPHRGDIERWIVNEVPAIARLAAPALSPVARIGLAGLSMGGYGALRLGAKYSDRFHAVSAHSAITEIIEMQSFVEEPLSRFLECAPREELSPLYWLRKHHSRLPRIRFDCGVDDALINGNRQLHATLEAESIAHHYEEFAGGHTWPYWRKHVEETLRFVSAV